MVVIIWFGKKDRVNVTSYSLQEKKFNMGKLTNYSSTEFMMIANCEECCTELYDLDGEEPPFLRVVYPAELCQPSGHTS